MRVENGMPATALALARWRKSTASNPSGSCVEITELPGDQAALRNSRDPCGPALIWPRTEIADFLRRVKKGEFDGVLKA
jgi:hypothetical protein